jgi:Tol biopolymer transport system component
VPLCVFAFFVVRRKHVVSLCRCGEHKRRLRPGMSFAIGSCPIKTQANKTRKKVKIATVKKLALGALAIALAGCGGSGNHFNPANFGGLLVFEVGGTLVTVDQDGANRRVVGTDFFVGSMSEGRKVAASTFSNDNFVVTANANGSHRRQITNQDDFRPAITPDGTKIAFISERDGNREIYIMDADGSNQTRLTTAPEEDYFPAFSADGTKILFTSKRDGNEEVYIMNADGSNQTRLTNNGASDTTPAFSPDGTQILFCTNRDGNYEIYKANIDGTNQTRITNTADEEVHASWNLAGTHIFYYDSFGVRRINPDGSGQTNIAQDGSKTCTWVYP